MSKTEDLAVPYHQQDTDYYCGAACAQMVLNSIGAPLLDQNDLYYMNHGHSVAESGWYTAPDGLEWTMFNMDPGSHWFTLFTLSDEDAISRKIVWTIHHYKVAPIAMVYGSQHWIVVRGYTASAAPSNVGDTSFTIMSLDVNNPWPPTPSASDSSLAPPPPHGTTDGCGSGGTRGIADENISYSTWQADYMTGVPGGYWAGKFIAVADPEPPPGRPNSPRKIVMQRFPQASLLTAKLAVERAHEGLKLYGLSERKNYTRILKRAQAAEPMLIQRLDRLDSFYYIVPVQEAPGVTPLVVAVDARSGEYRQSAISRADSGGIFSVLGRKASSERVIGQTVELPNQMGRLLVRPEAVCQYPHLVWKPCRESLSPFFPFHQFTVGDHRIYVRSDGAVFTQLHDTLRGI